jgi:hypothetical protein
MSEGRSQVTEDGGRNAEDEVRSETTESFRSIASNFPPRSALCHLSSSHPTSALRPLTSDI